MSGRKKLRNNSAQGEILLTSMDCDGTKSGYDTGADKSDRAKRVDPCDRLGRSGDTGAF